jgi:putative intracellular protease/amidase
MTQIPHLTGQIADYDIIVVAICAGTAILARAR